MAEITAENIGKKYHSNWCFRQIDVKIASNEVLVIKGKNGSGKSTLLKILANILSPNEGNISHFVETKIPINQVFEHISYCAPYVELIEEFRAKEMIDFHFKFKTFEDINQENLFWEKWNLKGQANKFLTEYSSGMKQRLKLGLALASNSNFIFLDEPCSHLDKESVELYKTHILSLKNKIIVIASNEPKEYEFLSHRSLTIGI